ncbi:hypothetical protein HOC01_03115 [archaeon]|jgi:hypothetical protein|nr:hypothetical protein [archaeon]MBT6698119.1 hypothetical protein [archaeon]
MRIVILIILVFSLLLSSCTLQSEGVIDITDKRNSFSLGDKISNAFSVFSKDVSKEESEVVVKVDVDYTVDYTGGEKEGLTYDSELLLDESYADLGDII